MDDGVIVQYIEELRLEALKLEAEAERRSDELDSEEYGRMRGRQHAFEDVADELRVLLMAIKGQPTPYDQEREL